jgi:hypothetical protein
VALPFLIGSSISWGETSLKVKMRRLEPFQNMVKGTYESNNGLYIRIGVHMTKLLKHLGR